MIGPNARKVWVNFDGDVIKITVQQAIDGVINRLWRDWYASADEAWYWGQP